MGSEIFNVMLLTQVSLLPTRSGFSKGGKESSACLTQLMHKYCSPYGKVAVNDQ